MYIWGIVEWLKHKNGETRTVEVNSIKWKEWLIVALCSIVVFVGFYFLLKALNTNELIVSTLYVVDNIFAVYLLARRSKYGFVSCIVNDLILIVLWGIPIIQGNLLLLAMLINPIMNLINDTYGVINWTKMQRKQKTE
jgi:nicotinamide mononucleotide transporter PnuC